MQNVALRIYSGSMAVNEIKEAVGLQIFWFAVLIFMGSTLCRYAEKKVTVQGG